MQEQYNRIKNEYPDAVILFRLGDFYETFDEDAILVSKVLGITLTGRGKNENRTPLAGIPYHALKNYLPKLIEANLKIAIADQMEEPIAGKLVERQVTKLITPGTILDENSLDASKNNYIASIFLEGEILSLSYCDLSTGELTAFEATSPTALRIEMNKISPAEVIVVSSQHETIMKLINSNGKIRFEALEEKKADLKVNYNLLKNQFSTTNLKGFGIEDKKEIIISTGILIQYLKECQKTELNHIKGIRIYNHSDFMNLDSETIRNLELIYPMNPSSSSQEATLFNILNECETSMGKRKLRNWIINPLVNKEILKDRVKAVDYFFSNPMVTSELRENLRNIIDIERVVGRIGVGSANPKDIYALKQSLMFVLDLVSNLEKAEGTDHPTRLKFLVNNVKELENSIQSEVIDLIDKSIKEDPPGLINEGGVINDGYNSEIDELRELRKSSKTILAKMQSEEIQKTQIPSLKISFNSVFGYYIEVTRTHLGKVPEHYIRKQTLANAERYITEELKIIEEKILTAQDKLIKLENELYRDILGQLNKSIPDLLNLGQIIAELDALSNFGYISRKYQYCKPEISDSEGILEISKGRHPIVERITESFTANSTLFNSKEVIHILTGPNMSGKSTYIRQVALITLIAQIGCFVPAEEMKFSIVDRIFTRVGASDNLSHGESTFMVEMNETANILNNANQKSLIILDEVGRGTSTYDGVAIAWSIIEYIAKNLKCKTLFATHYHELTELEEKIDCIKNYNVEVLEDNGKIMFKHKIIPGGANKSYGIHVAQLAGVPEDVIHRASEILKDFEEDDSSTKESVKDINSKKPPTPKKIHPSQLGLI